MSKRYQVFVSSTYADLKDERSKVIQTIMELDCIPAGMEIFPAIDEEQFNFIKSIIDDCDYYLLIIGGRYGSVSEDGISYTEKEYNYALEKGIKVIAFLHSDPDLIPLGKSETDSLLRKKLEEFRSKVSTNRLVKLWTTAQELPGLVSLSLSKTIKTYPAIGWIRANAVANPELLQELNEQRKENNELKEIISSLALKEKQMNVLADIHDEYAINGICKVTNGNHYIGWQSVLTWAKIFALISPYLLETHYEHDVRRKLTMVVFRKSESYSKGEDAEINEEIFQTIKIHFMALELINIVPDSDTLYWYLTEKGQQTMLQVASVRKS